MNKALLVSLLSWTVAVGSPAACLNYADFNSTAGLTLAGIAAPTNGVLRLTPALDSQTGDAWLQGKQACAGGFDTTFHFRITTLGNIYGNEPGGDGFTFSVQNVGPADLSWATGGTSNYVSVFFNTFWNWPGCTCPDVSDNSVGILVNQTYIAQNDLNPFGIQMSDGSVHQARVLFDGAGMSIWVDGIIVLTNVPLAGLQPGVDNSGQGWVGFTAGTGAAYENHDILDWSFCPTNVPPPPPQCVSPVSGLVSWWRAENNALDSADGNNGTVQGPVSYVSGEAGQAFDFNGYYSGVQLGNPANLQLQTFTIEAWVKRHSATQGTLDPSHPDNGAFLHYDIGGYAFAPANDGRLLLSKVGVSGVYSSTLRLTDTNGFHHVAVTTTGSNVVFYLDGVAEPVGSYDPGYTFGGPVAIGGRGGDLAASFYGAIDELSVYSRALSSDEILALFNAGSAGKCPPAGTNSCVTPSAGLVGWWPGEGNANDVLGGNNGTLEGGVTFAPGEVGQGFRLDGTNSYVQIPDSAALKPTNVTVEAWVWLDPAVTAPRLDFIIFKKNSWDYLFEGYSLLKQSLPNGGGTFIDRFSFVVSSDGNQVITYSTTAVQRGVWYHVAGTYDGNRLTLWVNGVPEATAIAGFALDYGTLPVFIGTSGQPEPYNGKLAGIIDEAAIYNRALSSNEIAAIYNAGSAGKCPTNAPPPDCTAAPAGLVSWWQGENSTLDSVDGNNGVLAGDAAFGPGMAGQGFVFNGSGNAVQLGAAPNLQLQDFSIETWIKRSDATLVTPIPDQDSVFFSYGSGGYGFGLTSEGRPFLTRVDISADIAPAVISDLNFHHVAMTKSGTNVIFYVDGVAYTALPYTDVFNFDTPAALGARGDNLGNSFLGTVDELGIYSRALSSDEILAIYNAGSAGKCPPPPTPPAVPVVISFNPSSGAPGSIVQIHGTNFSSIASNNIVYCGAVRATVLAATPFLLDVLVPVGATYAPLTVAVNGLVAASGTPFQPEFFGGSNVTASSFAPRVDLAAPSGPIFTAIADLDGDGKPDLIVNNAYAHSLSLYRNISTTGSLETNSFAAPVNFDVAGGDPDNPYGLAVADVDGDGKLDVVICNRLLNLVTVYRNTSTVGSLTIASLAPPVSFPVGTDPRHVVVADLNGDGKADMVCANYGANAVSLLQNIGSAGTLTSNSFTAAVDLPVGSASYDVAIADLDGDGKPDLAVTADSLSLFRNIGAGGTLGASSFEARVALPSPPEIGIGIAVGDLDGDGKPDLVTCTYLTQTMSVFRNQATPGSLSPASFAARVDFDTGGRGHTVALGDVNGDGKADISFVGEIPDQFSVYQNVSTPGSFTTASLAPRVNFPTGYNAWGVSVGDLDGDGRPDVVFCNSYDSSISIYRNLMPISNTTGCTPPPSGLVSWWRAENNAVDSVGGNNGGVYGASYVPGKVGLAFDFTATHSAISLATPPNLQLQNFTIEAWVKRHSATQATLDLGGYGSILSGIDSFGLYMTDDGRPGLNQAVFGVISSVATSTLMLTDTGDFHHVAVTKDGSTVTFYLDGVAETVAPYNPPLVSEQGVIIGAEANAFGQSFYGAIDELSVYDHALSTSEIQAIYSASSAGKCDVAVLPSIYSPPKSLTIYAGNAASFASWSSGSAPLSFQWLFNGAPLSGKTGTVLIIPNAQPTNSGKYSIVASNFVGSVSADADLTVLPLPNCTPPPSGLVSWWRFENSVLDNWDSNNGTAPVGSAFIDGKVGQAFSASQRFVLVPDAPSLQFSNALTIEAWVKPTVVSGTGPRTIVSKFDSMQFIPLANQSSFFLGTTNNNKVLFAISSNGVARSNITLIASQSLPTNVWSLVVATYDGTALRLYLNGSLAAQSNYSKGIFMGTDNLGIGGVPFNGTTFSWPFTGGIDEVSLYNRALSADEILAIYNSDFIGKCLMPPTITAQPLSQVVPLNEDVKFSVSVLGTRPLKYQWRFNGMTIFGATNSTLILEKLKTNNIGFYTVLVSNSAGTALSAGAALKVSAPLGCTPPLAGTISWWPADNSYSDAIDGNNAFPGAPAFPPFNTIGKVNQAFNLNGISSRITVNNSASLNFGSNVNFSIEGWIKALPPTSDPQNFQIYRFPNTPIVEKRSTLIPAGVGYSLSLYQGRLAISLSTNTPYPNLVANSTMFISSGSDLRDGMFHHVAVTLDRSSTTGGKLFVDGNVVLVFNALPYRGDLSNSGQLLIGGPTTTLSNSFFYGSIDELAIYNRALSTNEIQAIAGAGSAGKCKVPPTIVTQPVSQTVPLGSNATFTVIATGSPTLRYQWFRNNGLLPSGTNSTLVFSNVTGQVIGLYFVRVTNYFGTVNSSNAVLLVGPASLPAASVLQFSLTGGQPLLQFTGVAGQSYLVQASTNLVDWKVIGSATDLGDGNFEFADPDWTNYSACFYRIIVP